MPTSRYIIQSAFRTVKNVCIKCSLNCNEFKFQISAGYNADGWFIGGKYSNGRWTWSDGSPMVYQNFPGGNRFTSMAQDVTNYAFIMKNGYAWGYVSPFGTQRMGYICESTRC